MDDLISRAAAIAQIGKCGALSGIGLEPVMAVRDVKTLISVLPAVDAMPVVHARWIKPVPGDGEAYCSNCKHDALPCGYYLNPALMKYYETAYCPYCGAKMDGERRDEDAAN